MLGLYHHAYKGREGFELPAELDPLPVFLRPQAVESAAKVLGEGDDHDIELRRRRAVATLVATGRNADDEFESLVHSIYPDPDASPPPGIFDPGVTVDWVFANLGPASCVCSNIQKEVKRRPNFPMITDCTVSVRVNKKLKPVCDALDPQNWARCSDFFTKVYPAKPVNGKYPGSGEHNAGVGPSPGAPGSKWSDIVFEHFWMPWGGLSVSWFRNYLDIVTHPTPGKYRVDYVLKRAIGSSVAFIQQDGGLDVDSGWILIEDAGSGNTEVTMQKSIRFTDRTPHAAAAQGTLDWGETLNYIAPFVLLAQVEEAVCDNVCCGA